MSSLLDYELGAGSSYTYRTRYVKSVASMYTGTSKEVNPYLIRHSDHLSNLVVIGMHPWIVI